MRHFKHSPRFGHIEVPLYLTSLFFPFSSKVHVPVDHISLTQSKQLDIQSQIKISNRNGNNKPSNIYTHGLYTIDNSIQLRWFTK